MKQDGGKTMKLRTGLIITIFLILLSCSVEIPQGTSGTATLHITVTEAVGKYIVITGISPDIEETFWSYRLTKTDGGMADGATDGRVKMGSEGATPRISFGSWLVEVWGYADDACSKVVYYGSGEAVVVKGGTSCTVTVSPLTDTTQAHTLTPHVLPMKNSVLYLCPIGAEGEGVSDMMSRAMWYYEDTLLSEWNYSNGVWKVNGTAVPESGVSYSIEPGESRHISLRVYDISNNRIAGEGFVEMPVCMNCTYSISGNVTPRADSVGIEFIVSGAPDFTMEAEDVVVVIDKMSDITDSPYSGSCIIGYEPFSGTDSSAVNSTDLSNAVSFPFYTAADTVKESYAAYELGLRPIYVSNLSDLNASGATEIIAGRSFQAGASSSNPNTTVRKIHVMRDGVAFEAFRYFTGLEEVTFDEGLTGISGSAFRDCTSLSKVNLPQSLTSIQSYAFSGCTSLEEVRIPAGVTAISQDAFPNLKKMHFDVTSGWQFRMMGEWYDFTEAQVSDPGYMAGYSWAQMRRIT